LYYKIFIIIVNWNRKECIRTCLKSLARISYPNYEVVVVDNASIDGSIEEIESNFPDVRIVKNSENLGYTGGNNVGMRYALDRAADYILLMNDDIIVSPNLVEELVKAFKCSSEKVGMTGPRIKCWPTTNRLYQQYGRTNYYLQLGCMDLNNATKPAEVEWIYGTCALISREVVERVGFLDNNFFLYFEDADFCERVRKAGYKIVYVPSAIVYHDVSESFSGTMNPVELYYVTRNELLFARKHLNPLIFFPLFLPRIVFRMITYWVESQDISMIESIFRGFADFMKGKYGKTITPVPRRKEDALQAKESGIQQRCMKRL
jgi:GT2 family glycosyltransferase